MSGDEFAPALSDGVEEYAERSYRHDGDKAGLVPPDPPEPNGCCHPPADHAAHVRHTEASADVETLNELAAEIRRIDGSHTLGAGALAEGLMPWLAAHTAAARAEERERIAAAMKVESDKAAVRELSDPNAYARRVAYDNAARIARADSEAQR